jgi:hypothetical protein
VCGVKGGGKQEGEMGQRSIMVKQGWLRGRRGRRRRLAHFQVEPASVAVTRPFPGGARRALGAEHPFQADPASGGGASKTGVGRTPGRHIHGQGMRACDSGDEGMRPV